MIRSTSFDQHGSLIGQYLWQRYHHTASLARAANARLAQVNTLRPEGEHYPWAVVARAMGYRLRYSFAITPPALLLARRGARLLTQAPASPYPLALVEALFAGLRTTVAQIDPVGRLLVLEAEERLNRACYALGLCEDVARTGRLAASPLLAPGLSRTLAGVLALAEPGCVADMAQMATRFVATQGEMLKRPHVLFPTFGGAFAGGGALGPLIAGDCLYTIKVTTQPAVEARWLRELMGYLLLDERDQYHLHSVGIIAPRQGVVLRWPVAEFAAKLADVPHADVSALRREFAALRRASGDRDRAPLPQAG